MTRGPKPKNRTELTGDAESAWHALTAALATKTPPCTGDARFIQDGLSQPQQTELGEICAGCALIAQCSGFADQVAPRHSAGFWAGRPRGSGRRDYAPRREVAA